MFCRRDFCFAASVSQKYNKYQKEIMDIFRKLADQGKCVIIVSHSPEVARMCDTRFELQKTDSLRQQHGL